ncbi:DNA cytosine methyltransferase [Sneathiella aquimaris]|uniref:DNA cytosine methyltransferase n=1 Tax=Sneathiella aquimaris TaxID=2599305 RepID=UPI00146E77DF|nr:DNA cytosine methyltransferase [Sneathiella aquimaris]
MDTVELFAGAGGLAMGLSFAGCKPKAVIEWDKWACDTIRENTTNAFPIVKDWPLIEGDVRDYNFQTLEGKIDIVAGGPPCQPFSLGGKHRAYNDDRDMFPVTVDVIRQLKPKAFIVENVKGLTRPSFANYFQYIVLQLTYPDIVRKPSEEPHQHLARLEKAKSSNTKSSLKYQVITRVVNAADYGVPQKRERVFFVGFRSDLGVQWSFPEPTHSYDALLESQWINGEYWDRHNMFANAKRLTPREAKRIERLRKSNVRPLSNSKPWMTVRDALFDLPDPASQKSSLIHLNHKFQAGAKQYPGHTGSPLDLPSKALKAGVHGVPGGENMMVLDNGRVRYFTVREAARLQTFPDGYQFHGAWSETMRQLGNAVPVHLAQVVASSVVQKLLTREERELKLHHSKLN